MHLLVDFSFSQGSEWNAADLDELQDIGYVECY